MFWTKKKTPSLSPMLLEIKNELKKKRKGMSNIGKEANLAMEEKRLVQQITARTKEKNENNVTRTAAYLDFYKRHPEIHWAFLGHMVSRNGGWNMTDLKGELLRIKDCQIQPGVPRIYSPQLLYAWKNVVHEEAERGDWFEDWNVVEYLAESNEQINGEITNAYCETLEKMELAIIAKNAFFHSR